MRGGYKIFQEIFVGCDVLKKCKILLILTRILKILTFLKSQKKEQIYKIVINDITIYLLKM